MDRERRALAGLAIDRDGASVRAYERGNDRKAETASTDLCGELGVGAIEALEDIRQMFVGDPDTAIDDANDRLFVGRLGLDRDRRTRGRKFRRVVDEVKHDVAQ